MSEDLIISLCIVAIILIFLIIRSGRIGKNFRVVNIVILFVYAMFFAFSYEGVTGDTLGWWFYFIFLMLLQIAVITICFIYRFLKKLF